MALNLESTFKIVASVAGTGAVKELSGEIKKISSESENARRGFALMGKAAKTFISGWIAFQGVGMLKSMATQVINLGDFFYDTAQKVGIAASTLSGWQTAADNAGTSVESLAKGFSKLNQNIFAATSGNGQLSAIFGEKGLAIALRDANGNLRDTDDILLDLADRFAAMEDGAVKNAIAIKLFGKAGADMIPFLNQGSKGIQQFNYQFSDQFIQQADTYGDTLGVLSAQFRQMTSQVLEGVLPWVNAMLGAFAELGKSTAKQTGLMEIFKQVLMGVGEFARYLALGVLLVVQSVKGLASSIVSLVEAAGALFTDDTVLGALDRGGKRLEKIGKDFVNSTSVLFSKESGSLTGQLFNITPPPPEQSTPSPVFKPESGFGLLEGEGKSWDDRIKKIRAEADAMHLSNLEKEIAINLAELEASGISKTSAEYKYLRDNLVGALTARERAKENKELDDYLFKEGQAIQLMQDEISYIGLTAIEVEKLKEARRIDAEYQEKSRDMTREGAAELRKATEEIKQQRLALIELQYEQERTFQAGATIALNDYMENIKDSASTAKNLFTNAFKGMEDALVQFTMTGKLNFADMARSIIADLVRIQIQQSIITPLLGAARSFFGGFGGGLGGQIDLGSAMPWLSANGNIMTSNGPLPLNTYATGGIARSPQLSVFGEGRMPEAYVPLPDGRSIPVTLQGEGNSGGDVTINMTINNTGTEESSQGNNQVNADMGKRLAVAIKSVIMNEMRPGGLLNKNNQQVA